MHLTLRDTARALGVDETQVLEWVRARGLPTCGRRGEVRVDDAALREWALTSGVPLDPAVLAPGAGPVAVHSPLCAALERGGVLDDVPGEGRMALLREVMARVPLPPGEDRAFVTEMVLAREALASTAVGGGVAIPHPRTPVVSNVDGPLVAVAYPRVPVDFGAADGVPVHVLFVQLAPSAAAHLAMLGRLAHALRDEGLRARLRARAPLAELLATLRALDAKGAP